MARQFDCPRPDSPEKLAGHRRLVARKMYAHRRTTLVFDNLSCSALRSGP